MKIFPGKNFELNLSLNLGCKPLEMLWVEPGSFIMGFSPSADFYIEDDPFEMEFSKGFWLGKYILTQSQWVSVMNSNPSLLVGNNFPVNNITWNDANDFCQKLNNQWSIDLPDDYKFSLPTEAQWEYSCRANTKLRNYGGNDFNDVLKIGWCLENSDKKLHDVGLKYPNQWGFYDMFGNVFEWCIDSITDYPKGKALDWIGTANTGDKYSKIQRGGCYLTPMKGDSFEAANRNYAPLDGKKPWIGFRLCLRVQSNK